MSALSPDVHQKAKEDTHDLEYVEKQCLCCKRKVVKDTVPASRVWALQRPELCFIVLALLASVINGCGMPSFALVFTEVRLVLPFLRPNPAPHSVTR